MITIYTVGIHLNGLGQMILINTCKIYFIEHSRKLSNTNLTCLSKPSAVSDLMGVHFSSDCTLKSIVLFETISHTTLNLHYLIIIALSIQNITSYSK